MFRSIFKNRILLFGMLAMLLGGANVARSQNKKINKPGPVNTKKPHNATLQKPAFTPAAGQSLSPTASPEGKKIYVFLKARCRTAYPYFKLLSTEFGPGKPGIIASCSSTDGFGFSYFLETTSGSVRSVLQLNGADQSRMGFMNLLHEGYYEVGQSDGYRTYYWWWKGHRYIPHNF